MSAETPAVLGNTIPVPTGATLVVMPGGVAVTVRRDFTPREVGSYVFKSDAGATVETVEVSATCPVPEPDEEDTPPEEE